MKALSIKQPWASLIVSGAKVVENRSRKWKHRGPLAIHASKNFDVDGFEWIMHNMGIDEVRICEDSKKLKGGFVGSVNMVDCITEHKSDFFFGPYGYVFENPKKCELIQYKGQQGIFNINYSSYIFLEMHEHFQGYYDCFCCGELHEKFPISDGLCPKCKSVMLPF